MKTQVQEFIADAAVRSTPPVTVSVIGSAMHLAEWVYIATLVYLVLQVIVIFPKVVNTFQRRRSDDKAS